MPPCNPSLYPSPCNPLLQLSSPSLSRFSSLRPFIGLEVHVQLCTSTKLFSRSQTDESGPNERVAPLDAAYPGVLPLLNRHAVTLALRTGLFLGCEVPRDSWFVRKHYFYADMPAGYQITQQDDPIARRGRFAYYLLEKGRMEKRFAIIDRLQLEQDSGKSLHEGKQSLIDLNRSGCALVEIVTSPCFSSGIEASSFVRQLRLGLMHYRVSNGQMHKGHLRVDANVSISRDGESLGQRTEIKNMNSIDHVETAVNYEIERQTKVIEDGGEVVFETRTVDRNGHTVVMREKESIDYRFLLEPNIPRLRIPTKMRDDATMVVSTSRPLHERLIEDYDFPPFAAVYLSEDESLAVFVNRCIEGRRGKEKKIKGEIFMGWLNELKQICQRRKTLFPPQREHFALRFIEILEMVEEGKVTKLVGLDGLRRFEEEEEEGTVEEWLEKEGLWRIRDEGEMEEMTRRIVAEKEGDRLKALAGNKKALSKLRNALMAQSKKRIDVDDASRVLQRILEEKR